MLIALNKEFTSWTMEKVFQVWKSFKLWYKYLKGYDEFPRPVQEHTVSKNFLNLNFHMCSFLKLTCQSRSAVGLVSVHSSCFAAVFPEIFGTCRIITQSIAQNIKCSHNRTKRLFKILLLMLRQWIDNFWLTFNTSTGSFNRIMHWRGIRNDFLVIDYCTYIILKELKILVVSLYQDFFHFCSPL